MHIRKENEEVLFADGKIVKVGHRDIKFLKEKANRNRRKRIRLCSHKNINDALHEMLIVHKKNAYIRPHKHLNKPESFHLIEGAGEVIIFDETGKIIEVIPMGDYASGSNFYYRISEPYYHTLFVKSNLLVFHETTNGPFKKSDTIFAPWSPEENDITAVRKFMKCITQIANDF